jgi:hypothetical protein
MWSAGPLSHVKAKACVDLFVGGCVGPLAATRERPFPAKKHLKRQISGRVVQTGLLGAKIRVVFCLTAFLARLEGATSPSAWLFAPLACVSASPVCWLGSGAMGHFFWDCVPPNRPTVRRSLAQTGRLSLPSLFQTSA